MPVQAAQPYSPYAHDRQAEEALVGACLLSPQALDAALEALRPEDLAVPTCSHVLWALERMRSEGLPTTDLVALQARMREEGYEVPAGDLLALQAGVASFGTAGVRAHARTILACKARREGLRAMSDFQEAALDPSVPPERLREMLERAARQVEVPTGNVPPAPDVDEFVGEEEVPYDWVVPGLLERGDRLLMTGGEGLGKSTLLRQMCLCIAAGRHPFQNRRIEPQRVLLVDLENPERLLRRTLRDLLGRVRHEGYDLQPGMLRIASKVEGLDIQQPNDVRWLTEQVQAAQPDVLYVGPLYKLGAVGNEEEPAKRVLKVLDTLRTRHRCALLMETHSPHSEPGASKRPLRPVGASIWMRWPEFGYGLQMTKDEQGRLSRETVNFEPWRGPRDVREWPHVLTRGRVMPWVEVAQDEEF